MPNQGFWADGLPGTADRLNAGTLQYGATASRPAAGQTGRRWWDTTLKRLERDNGATWDIIFETDPAAATPGLRTLGTGAAQAAAGDHSHTVTLGGAGSGTTGPSTSDSITVADVETDVASHTAGAAASHFDFVAGAVMVNTTADTHTYRIYTNAVLKMTLTGVTNSVGRALLADTTVVHTGTHTDKVTAQRTAGATGGTFWYGYIYSKAQTVALS